MLWIQSLGSFVLWILAGVWVFRRYRGEAGRKQGRLQGMVLLVLGGILMVLGMVMVASGGGLVEGRLTAGGWVSTTILGAIFVTLQTRGAMLVLASVMARETAPGGDTSQERETRR